LRPDIGKSKYKGGNLNEAGGNLNEYNHGVYVMYI